MYKVIRSFVDLEDGGRYRAGDTFPRAGVTVVAERLERLCGSANRRGIPLIAKEPDPAACDHPEESGMDGKKQKRAKKSK